MPTVTTGAVESGATTTSSPFASLLLSISMWNRFTHFPLLLLLLLSDPQNSFPVQPASRRNLERARGLLGNLRERADPSTRRVAPVFRNSPAPGVTEATTREWLRRVSFPTKRVTGWPLLPPRAHGRRPSRRRRGTKSFCCPRCAPAIRRVHGRSAAPLAPLAFPLP